jgi:hypothetical protein
VSIIRPRAENQAIIELAPRRQLRAIAEAALGVIMLGRGPGSWAATALAAISGAAYPVVAAPAGVEKIEADPASAAIVTAGCARFARFPALRDSLQIPRSLRSSTTSNPQMPSSSIGVCVSP